MAVLWFSFPMELFSAALALLGECAMVLAARVPNQSHFIRCRPPEIVQAGLRTRNRSRIPSIRGLLFWCRPAAVFGRIRPVIVDSVDAVPVRRSRTHVGIERHKRAGVTPSLADRNPASTVRRVAVICAFVAPAAHIAPYVVLRRVSQSVLWVVHVCQRSLLIPE